MTGPWRTLTCTRCRTPVQVLELPAVFIDPAVYVCGPCMRPKRSAEKRGGYQPVAEGQAPATPPPKRADAKPSAVPSRHRSAA